MGVPRNSYVKSQHLPSPCSWGVIHVKIFLFLDRYNFILPPPPLALLNQHLPLLGREGAHASLQNIDETSKPFRAYHGTQARTVRRTRPQMNLLQRSVVPQILLLDGNNRPSVESPQNTNRHPSVGSSSAFYNHQGIVEIGTFLQTYHHDMIAFIEAAKLLAVFSVTIGPALGLAGGRTIPCLATSLALEQDGKVGLLGGFTAAVAVSTTDGHKIWVRSIERVTRDILVDR